MSIWFTEPKPPKPFAPFLPCMRTVFNEAVPSSRKTYGGNGIAESMAGAVGTRNPCSCSGPGLGDLSHPSWKRWKNSHSYKLEFKWTCREQRAGDAQLGTAGMPGFPMAPVGTVWWGVLFGKKCLLSLRFCVQQPRALFAACSSVLSPALCSESCFLLSVEFLYVSWRLLLLPASSHFQQI